MVTIFKSYKTEGNKVTYELRGLADDSKPTKVEENVVDNGSEFIEIDTGDVYMYDLDNTSWYKVRSGSGDTPTPTPTSKFDYIIPSGLYDDIDTEISDQNIIDILEEISDNYLDENDNVKPLNIGIYMGNDEQSVNGVFTTISQISKGIDNKVKLKFTSNIDSITYCMIYYYNNSWHFSYN